MCPEFDKIIRKMHDNHWNAILLESRVTIKFVLYAHLLIGSFKMNKQLPGMDFITCKINQERVDLSENYGITIKDTWFVK